MQQVSPSLSTSHQLLNRSEINDWFTRTGRPYVTLSWAQSLDGSLTLKQGQSLPISCDESMRMTHQLRSDHDAILVGIGTALADNPRLTARIFDDGPSNQPPSQPRPIVLDSQLRIPTDLRLFTHPKRPIIATTQPDKNNHLAGVNAEIIQLPPTTNGQVPLAPLLNRLGQMGIRSVMVEGGGQVLTSFLNSNDANRAIITIAPLFVGGYDAIQPLSLNYESQLPRLHNMQTTRCGSDIIVAGDLF